MRKRLIQEKTIRTEQRNKNTKPTNYKEGLLILLKNETAKKLEEKYTGPYKLIEDLGPNVKIIIK